MGRLWRNYSLGIVYLAGWLLTWALHALFVYLVDQYPHGAAPWQMQWLEASFENLASEYHQVGAFVLLSRWFIFRDSPKSRDGDDQMQRTLERINGKLDSIGARLFGVPVEPLAPPEVNEDD